MQVEANSESGGLAGATFDTQIKTSYSDSSVKSEVESGLISGKSADATKSYFSAAKSKSGHVKIGTALDNNQILTPSSYQGWDTTIWNLKSGRLPTLYTTPEYIRTDCTNNQYFSNGACLCKQGFSQIGESCVCESPRTIQSDGTCSIPQNVCPNNQINTESGCGCLTGWTKTADSCSCSAPYFEIQNDGTCKQVKQYCEQGYEDYGYGCVPLQCQAGYKFSTTGCIPLSCPSGYQIQNNECVPQNNQASCPTGFTNTANGCTQITCPPGQTLNGNTCTQTKTTTCPSGYVLVNNQCQKAQCPLGFNLVGNNCVPNKNCPSGFEQLNGKCVAADREVKQWIPMADYWGPPYCDEDHRYNGPKICQKPEGQNLEGLDCSEYDTNQAIKTAYSIRFNYQCKIIACPNGHKMENNKCVKTCSTGYDFIDGECRLEGTICENGNCVQCRAGDILQNGICVTPRECPNGYDMINGKCTFVQLITCPVGQENVNGVCTDIQIKCAANEQLVGGACVKTSCSQGYELINGECKLMTCQPGFKLENNNCVKLQQAVDVTTCNQLANALNNNQDVNILNDLECSNTKFNVYEYSGKIEGNNNLINNLIIESTSSIGFILIANNAEINNLHFINAYIEGGEYTGLIAESNNVKLNNVGIYGIIKSNHQKGVVGLIALSKSTEYNKVYTQGEFYGDTIGGLFGKGSGNKIANSYSTVNFNGYTSTPTIQGGLIGEETGANEINLAYYSGRLAKTDTNNLNEYSNGLIGKANRNIGYAAYHNMDLSGSSQSCDLGCVSNRLTNDQAAIINSYAFDVRVWTISQNSYPYLIGSRNPIPAKQQILQEQSNQIRIKENSEYYYDYNRFGFEDVTFNLLIDKSQAIYDYFDIDQTTNGITFTPQAEFFADTPLQFTIQAVDILQNVREFGPYELYVENEPDQPELQYPVNDLIITNVNGNPSSLNYDNYFRSSDFTLYPNLKSDIEYSLNSQSRPDIINCNLNNGQLICNNPQTQGVNVIANKLTYSTYSQNFNSFAIVQRNLVIEDKLTKKSYAKGTDIEFEIQIYDIDKGIYINKLPGDSCTIYLSTSSYAMVFDNSWKFQSQLSKLGVNNYAIICKIGGKELHYKNSLTIYDIIENPKFTNAGSTPISQILNADDPENFPDLTLESNNNQINYLQPVDVRNVDFNNIQIEDEYISVNKNSLPDSFSSSLDQGAIAQITLSNVDCSAFTIRHSPGFIGNINTGDVIADNFALENNNQGSCYDDDICETFTCSNGEFRAQVKEFSTYYTADPRDRVDQLMDNYFTILLIVLLIILGSSYKLFRVHKILDSYQHKGL